jgi:phage FluMu protein Com
MSPNGIKLSGVVHLNEYGIVAEPKEIDLEKLQAIVDKYQGKRDALLLIIHDIRAEHQCLPTKALEFVAEKLSIPINKIYHVMDESAAGAELEAEKTGAPTIEYYPQCRDCGTRLTDTPFTDFDTVAVTSFFCPKCNKEEWFYIDLEKISRKKNMWCPTCCIFTREYNPDHECPNCGGEVFRTQSKSCKDRAVEYYPRCPECNKVLSQDPLCDVNTVSVIDIYCPHCEKSQWLYVDLSKMYKNA